MKSSLFVLGVWVVCGLASLSAEVRTFIDQNGRSLQGELVSANGELVTIKRSSDGLVFTVKASNFSKTDQDYFVSKGAVVKLTQPPVAPANLGTSATPKAIASTPAANTSSPMRIEAKVYPNKSDRPTNNAYDERTARVGFRVDIRNGEQQRPFSGGKATMMAFAKNLEDNQESKVISREEFDVTLEPLKTLTHDTKEVKLTYDNIAYKYGFKYYGYLLVVKDSTGKTVATVGSSGTIEKSAEDLLKFAAEDMFDKNNKKIEVAQ
ncbi:hypothetical protein DES53_10995 [Roseimicrobium gellanilyticum]|uniref:SLA1 homology domain-containing protein n=1 Tax=Roseimicrobium gellanilyticum TaxID=748857 RepID=A0A366HED1_9BACT|nr:hypothetical protein [Roseimicrobium gellanilyticum]RBP39668.1 hypothetical protein DES53_10995 [Roseimicrobium gellanilyticum]